MNGILEELGSLGGVHHGCIVKEGHVLATTFPSLLNDNLASIARITDRIFRGAGSVKHSYNEIYFEMDENYLLGFPVEGGLMVLLLTGKDINFALIHMTVQSAAPQISREMSASLQESSAPKAAPPGRAGAKIDHGLKPHLNEILEALTLQIGPVARISMGEGLKQWRNSYEPVKANLAQLIDILAEDIDDKGSRQEFLSSLASLADR